MALTETMAVSSATAKYGQPITATVTVSNSGGGSVNILSIDPIVVATSGSTIRSVPVAVGVPPTGQGSTVAVAASGTLALSWTLVFHHPYKGNTETEAEKSSQVYDVGCIVYGADGSISSPTVTTVTVSNT